MQGLPSLNRTRRTFGRVALWGLLCGTMAAAMASLPVAAQAAEMVSVRSKVLNMRAGPGARHAAQWQLERGYPLAVIGRQGDWFKVRDFENDTGWVARKLTGKQPHHIVKSSVANMRSGPGSRYRVLGKAQYGEVLRTLEKRDSWVKVQREDGSKGWVARSLLWGW
jgi:uncharacterized protein YgiM (DUF1202 family)